MNSNDAMNNQLTKKEKKIKLTEARRRAILWSEKEIRKRHLRAQAQFETISISEHSESATTLSQHSDITNQSLNENIIPGLQKTIQDLKIQRQELDITIKVLSNHLNNLLNNSNYKAKGHKRSKNHG